MRSEPGSYDWRTSALRHRVEGAQISKNDTDISNGPEETTHQSQTRPDLTEGKGAGEEKAQLTAQIESQRQRLNSIVASVPGVGWEAWGQPDAAKQMMR